VEVRDKKANLWGIVVRDIGHKVWEIKLSPDCVHPGGNLIEQKSTQLKILGLDPPKDRGSIPTLQDENSPPLTANAGAGGNISTSSACPRPAQTHQTIGHEAEATLNASSTAHGDSITPPPKSRLHPRN
jgi:hypothetical protein